MNEEISLVEVLFTVAVVGRESDQSDASSRRGQRVVSLSVCSEPGRGCEGTSCLSCGAGDDGAVGEALQAQLAYVGEDGLHVKLRHQLLEMKAHLLLTIPQGHRKAAFPQTQKSFISPRLIHFASSVVHSRCGTCAWGVPAAACGRSGWCK